MITYKRMSLFDAPPGSYLVHACNTAGVWGSGIAAEFKRRYPHAFAVYERSCQGNSSFALGKSWSIWDREHVVTCLLTSQGYGRWKSPKEDILRYTEMALNSFMQYVTEGTLRSDNRRMPIYSNKFNSGLFGVPWEETEAILKKLTDQHRLDWTVCDPVGVAE
jgi:ADP-ribose 1''-phosphate phosphatase